ncbi:Extracellular protein [Apiospora hydei]|uniref:Extracellular protein n=1 Tax=Apiospora hydei TaxID=1337664 RepID=A0ABR1XDL2_9PEZI
MRVSHIVTLAVALAAETVLGHMNMADPPPLRYKGNPNAVKAGKVDSDITSPNTATTFPCKGAIPDFDDPIAGAPVATWYPGEQHNVKIEGGASHNGGSCQLSLSYDKGQTFTVVFSKIGACPTDPNIPFTLPADTPSADKVLFSWSWINHTGNREFYNNCAVLTIGAAKKNKKRTAPAVAFKDRPAMLVADLYHVAGAACVKEGVDALYPEPGPDFVNVSSSAALPDDCVTGQPMSSNPIVGGSGGSAGSGSGGAPASGSASAPAGPGATASKSAYVSSSSSSSFSSSPALLASPSMFSSLLMPLPTSSLHSSSPSASETSCTSPASTPSISSSPSGGSTLGYVDKVGICVFFCGCCCVAVAHCDPDHYFPPNPHSVADADQQHLLIRLLVCLSIYAPNSAPNATPSSGVPTTPSTTPSATSSEVVGLPSQTSTATSSAAPPAGTGSPGGNGGGSLSGPCTPEGEWNCLSDGTSWQRCASGLWSAVMPMAPGTTCTPGQSSTLSKRREQYVRRRNAVRRNAVRRDPVRRRA